MSSELIGTGPARIGRYFTVGSAIPSTVFVAYLLILLKTGAWNGAVDWSAVKDLSLGDGVTLGVISLATAMALHPVQFSLVRLFEGYWGTSRAFRRLALWRTMHHRRRMAALEDDAQSVPGSPAPRYDPMSDIEASTEVVATSILRDEAQREWDSYPDVRRVMPTRLGNVLRRYEDLAGRPYGIDTVRTVPRLAMVAGAREVEYVENQRIQLDLAVRTTFLAIMAAAATLVIMSRNGLWMMIALVPYGVSVLAYRGAIAVAHEYGTSLAVLMEFGRFPLYERLHLATPKNTIEEIAHNAKLMTAFQGSRRTRLTYVEREVGSPPDALPHDSGTDT